MNVALAKKNPLTSVGNRLPTASDLAKVWLGGETFLDNLFDWSHDTSYPRYNIVKMEDQGYRVEFAVPGMDKEDLHVTLKDGWLTVSGDSVSFIDEENERYVHKGLSSKAFSKGFKISESLKHERTYLENGMLYIELFFDKEEQKAVEIPIQQY